MRLARFSSCNKDAIVAAVGAPAAWTAEPLPTLRDLPRLTPAEGALYDELRWLRLSEQALRLEQERIGFGCVLQASSAGMSGHQTAHNRGHGHPDPALDPVHHGH